MMPTIKLSDIVAKWRDAIKNSTEINNFCLTNYGEDLTLFVGVNKKSPPKDKDYPLVVLRPGVKIEGEEEEEFRYSISVGWGIINENVSVVGNVEEIEGIAECDELGQLILQELAAVNPAHPLSTIEYEIEAVEFFPKIIGEMAIEISITVPIGANLVY